MRFNLPDEQYLALLAECLTYGEPRPDRTGVGVRSLFGRQMRFNLAEAFPLLTTKRLHWPAIVWELLWVLEGRTNSRWLEERGVTIWKEWADEEGELGPIYGKQFRSWADGAGTIDQIGRLVRALAENPYDRGHVVSAWNVAELEGMALRPCHCLWQMYVSVDGRLSCQLYQRSGDIFLGVPFNMASYSLLTLMMAHTLGLEPGEFIHTFGDVHLYENHVEQARTQIERLPLQPPTVVIDGPLGALDGWAFADLRLEGYRPHSAIHAPVAV